VNLIWTTPADAPAMAEVHAQAFDGAWDAEAFCDLMDAVGVFGLLAGSPPAAGVILCRVAAGEMEVLTIGVAPTARQRGVGKALMTAALGAARQAGAEAVFLEVAVDNAAAVALYAGLGFRRAGLRRGYYHRGAAGQADALVMRLDLSDA
jgi:ribosomal-protein-alanine N-acetyltransferase